jgi:hypothetical protein
VDRSGWCYPYGCCDKRLWLWFTAAFSPAMVKRKSASGIVARQSASMNWDLWSHATAGSLFVLLTLNVGAVYRICRIVARDSITDRPRAWLSTRFHGMLVNLLLCMWCLSFWLGIAAVLLTSWNTTRETWLVIAAMLSISTAVGVISERA